MELKLLNLKLTNFKGIKNLSIDFKDNTSISGKNESGKTSIFDAFTWLLFGKNSLDQKDFSIKTLDENNNAIPKIDHEVTGTLGLDGSNMVLKRVYREKWTKQRGEPESTFTGHETEYFINSVPMQQKQYQEQIASIIDEKVFKILTNPYYFNQIAWLERREMLFKLAGSITDGEIAAGNKEFEKLLNKGKRLDDYKKELSSKRKLLKDSLDSIPTRIDEINRNMPEPVNVTEIEKQIIELDTQIKSIDDQITSKNKAWEKKNSEILEKKKELAKLKDKLSDVEYKVKEELKTASREQESAGNEIRDKIKKLNDLILDSQEDLTRNTNYLKQLTIQKDELLKKWHSRNAEEFKPDDDKFTCPVNKEWNCPFGDEAVEDSTKKALESFNEKKRQDLANITEEGKTLNLKIEEYQERLKPVSVDLRKAGEEMAELDKQAKDLHFAEKKPVMSLESMLLNNVDYQAVLKKIEEFVIPDIKEIDLSSFKETKTGKTNQRDELKKKLALNSVIEQNQTRIKELEKESKDLAQQIANLEKEEFCIDSFTKLKIETLEARINGKFTYVRFKLFNKLINGGSEECCEALYNGVPYSDLNHAAKVNCGIDIINTFSDFYDIYCPIFCDDADLVNNFIETKEQIIKLIVTHESLKITYN